MAKRIVRKDEHDRARLCVEERRESVKVAFLALVSFSGGSKFRCDVSRLHCESESFKMDLILDINCWLYPMELGDKFRLVLATTLREDGYPDGNEWNATEQEGGSRADSFEYVMSGKVYRIEGDEASNEPSSRLSAYVSFGGLLMRLQGDANNLHGFEIDQYMYLLMKKLAF
ncbi:PREDICTED: DNA-directed RNA polymerases I, II, and III subunit RPABC3 isoform X1 [Dinoponera quadriceps]|uniref:Probable DNA-directed RNA polymerases I, II, and III subunit RPABC3 n=1 Tax=Dinoponera quadriceps TaxID=609295 RepID=A0A6P3XUS1_DINQU|nr:PREDICTED: DNA-directed RNA polymerases I, II, and III subunit RPABC3 isoform X1 [Dinoponera quadriceps]